MKQMNKERYQLTMELLFQPMGTGWKTYNFVPIRG